MRSELHYCHAHPALGSGARVTRPSESKHATLGLCPMLAEANFKGQCMSEGRVGVHQSHVDPCMDARVKCGPRATERADTRGGHSSNSDRTFGVKWARYCVAAQPWGRGFAGPQTAEWQASPRLFGALEASSPSQEVHLLQTGSLWVGICVHDVPVRHMPGAVQVHLLRTCHFSRCMCSLGPSCPSGRGDVL